MATKKTVLVRCPKDIHDEWKLKFPGLESSAMIRFMWNSSLLKLESRLREKKIKM